MPITIQTHEEFFLRFVVMKSIILCLFFVCLYALFVCLFCLFACLFWASCVAMARGGSRRKETSKKSILDYKEVYDELVNQNEIPTKMTATKEDRNN